MNVETLAALLTSAGTIGAAAVGFLRKFKDLPSDASLKDLHDDVLRLEGKVDASLEAVEGVRDDVARLSIKVEDLEERTSDVDLRPR